MQSPRNPILMRVDAQEIQKFIAQNVPNFTTISLRELRRRYRKTFETRTHAPLEFDLIETLTLLAKDEKIFQYKKKSRGPYTHYSFSNKCVNKKYRAVLREDIRYDSD